jgi:hypothetical protein
MSPVFDDAHRLSGHPERLRLGPPSLVVPVPGGSGRGFILRAVKNGAGVARVTGPAVVTAADMVAGHVRLDNLLPGPLYLNGFVAKLQTPGGVAYFFHDHRGKPIVSRPCSSQSGRS